jgi:hypothetical protein
MHPPSHIHEQIIDFLTEDFMDDNLFRHLPCIKRPCVLQELHQTLLRDIELSYEKDFSKKLWSELTAHIVVKESPFIQSYLCGIYCFFRHYITSIPLQPKARWDYLKTKIQGDSSYIAGKTTQNKLVLHCKWNSLYLLTQKSSHYCVLHTLHKFIKIQLHNYILKKNLKSYNVQSSLDHQDIPFLVDLDIVWPLIKNNIRQRTKQLRHRLYQYPDEWPLLIFKYMLILLQINYEHLLTYFVISEKLLLGYYNSVVYRLQDTLNDLC